MPKTGENKKPIQFPRKFHRSTGTSHFPGNVLFVDEIHRGDQYGCLTHFFSNFLGILMGFRGHVNKIPIFSQSPIDPPPGPTNMRG